MKSEFIHFLLFLQKKQDIGKALINLSILGTYRLLTSFLNVLQILDDSVLRKYFIFSPVCPLNYLGETFLNIGNESLLALIDTGVTLPALNPVTIK